MRRAILMAAALLVFGCGQVMEHGGIPVIDQIIGDRPDKDDVAFLAGPYEDPAQQNIPFGRRSWFLTPWRAYMDTWPAARFLEVPGVNFNVHNPRHFDAAAAILADAGIRSARVEVGWGSFLYDDPTQMSDPTTLRQRISALKVHGIRPIILLNANAGWPCPIRGFAVELRLDAPAGAREIFVDRVDEVVLGRTGLRDMDYQIAFPLIVKTDPATGWCELSAPLPKPLKAGRLELFTLKYEPFAGATFADGSPNPAARETLDGWMTYVAAICREMKDALGPQGAADAGFDLEVWNEYTFGSQFLDNANYHEPDRAFSEPVRYAAHGRTAEGVEIILPMTVDFVNDPANALAGVRVISGFANQRPWENGTDLWPGQAGFSRHYYTGVNPDRSSWVSPENNKDQHDGPLNALGQPDGRPDGKDWHTAEPGSFFIPTLAKSLPEYYHYAYQTEFMTRDLQPFPGPWEKHHRFTHNGDGRPAQVWMTEFNTHRRPFAEALTRQGVAETDPRLRSLMHHLGTKALLRAMVFHGHKGVHTINVYATQENDLDFAVLPEAFFAALEQSGGVMTDEVKAAAGEQAAVLRRVTELMRKGRPIEEARPLSVLALGEHEPRKVFDGDGTPEHPDKWNRDDFACLPFQLEPGRFAVACYVVTRDLTRVYDESRDPLDPARYDMSEQTFDLTLGNLRGKGAKVSLWDPVLDREIDVETDDARRDALTVRLPVVDYPRFLLIHENKAGPLVLSPRLLVDVSGGGGGGGEVTFSFSTEMKTTPTVTWGPLPDRNAGGSITLDRGHQHVARFPLQPGEGVRVTVEHDGVTATWPRWGHDVKGVRR